MAALQELCSALNTAKSNFVCGGSVKVDSNHTGFPREEHPATCAPVTIRWDGDGVNKVTFPREATGAEDDALTRLLAAGQQATFGLEGRDVLDEAYRKAIKIDNTDFSTNFHPHDCGILDGIRQTLFSTLVSSSSPDTKEKKEQEKMNADFAKANRMAFGIVAQLYKLNVYSAPSGKFKSHVDTPRAPEQFGSLVVCLPSPHQGGQLRVAHNGTDMMYDWSNKDNHEIRWVAFFSDCEHEVLEVKQGHRVTLTYNLFMSPFPILAICRTPLGTPNPEMYPVFQMARALLEDPEFMKKGGTVGFKCTHAYAHAHKDVKKALPFALKGLDAVVYAIFKHLGTEVRVLPVLHGRDWGDRTYDPFGYEHSDSDPSARGLSLSERRRKYPRGWGRDCIGSRLHSTVLIQDYEDEEASVEVVGENWSFDRDNVTWLNENSTSDDLAIAFLAYGNETSLEWMYSFAALIIDIPSFAERNQATEGPSKEKPYVGET